REAVAALPPHYREPLLLRYYLNYEYAEIAALLHIPEGTVKSRLHRAIGELRAILIPGGVAKDKATMKGA
ncbi:MAG: sigma factor-like helix-turn-helix DNA-binding protein, partial [Clostridiales bacterium]